MFLIHKHSIVQKYNKSLGGYEKILASEIQEGDILRGYDLINLKYTKMRVASRVAIPARTIELRTTHFEKILISESTILASTRGPWNFKCPFQVKLFKKLPFANSLNTPKPIGSDFGDIAHFISIAISEENPTLLVDEYVQVTENWNGQQIKGKSDNNLKTSVVTRLSQN
jgi:hypothetical protein